MPAITRQLLIRYFKGQCSQEENEAVQTFIAAETDPVLVATAMQDAFEMQSPDQLLPLSEQDYNNAWQQFRQKSGGQPAAVLPAAKQLRLSTWLRYAAAAVLIVAISVAGWKTIGPHQRAAGALADAAPQRIQAIKGVTKRVTLTDGSTVYLFPGSELLVPDAFNKKDRTVQLKGRAFFDVTKNPQQPFLVQTGDLSTTVLGTSFEVNSNHDQQVAITVRTGLVSVHHNKNELARLPPNQQMLYQTTSGAFTVNSADAAGLCSWITGELMFDRTPLTEVCQTLEQWYGVTIQLNADQWRNKKISVKFKQLPLSTVLQILSATSRFKYEIKDNHIKII